ncbi:hypothetical protein ACFXO9_26690 [Nocardia tengchongensis]|uniref:hypothetical protein n=1 Tax=Nocardia tengchongensis TaxID=2055889 RepID=UPI0036AE5EB2
MSEPPDDNDAAASGRPADIAVLVICDRCGDTQEFPISFPVFIGWAARRIPVQDAFAHLSAPEREFIKSQVCPACWTTQFGAHRHHV